MSQINIEKENILIVSHQYNQFVKSQIDEIAEYYNNITVLVRYNPIASISKYVPIDYLKRFSKQTKINYKNKPRNVDIIPLPILYFPTSLSRRRLGERHAKKAIKTIQKHSVDFDLVHSHISWTAGYAGQKISDEFGVPHVITVHENKDWLNSLLNSNNSDLFYAWKKADCLIRVSPNQIEELKQYNENTVQIPNGFDKRRFQPIPKKAARRELALEEGKKLLFSLGKLIDRKGFQNTIFILPEFDDVRYVIGGHGPMKSTYKKKAEQLGVEERLQLPGYIPNEDLKYWMSAADLFVFPSYSESFGLVQLEAMACGTPVIAARNGGSEYILNDSVGILFDHPENHKQFKQAIDEGLHRDWSANEIVSYAEQYTIPSVCEKIVEVHEECITY